MTPEAGNGEGRERDVSTGRTGLRREYRVSAVLGPNAVETAANANNAGIQVESIGTPLEREEFTEAQSGAEGEGDKGAPKLRFNAASSRSACSRIAAASSGVRMRAGFSPAADVSTRTPEHGFRASSP